MNAKLLVATATLLTLAGLVGCSSCGQPSMGGWFHRGDKCYPPSDCPPGMPRATMMLPSTPQVMPGPIEIAPSP
jgi:hypothetical protein